MQEDRSPIFGRPFFFCNHLHKRLVKNAVEPPYSAEEAVYFAKELLYSAEEAVYFAEEAV